MTLELSAEDIEDIVSAALCGGIYYWAILDNSRKEYADMGEDDCIDTWTAKILMDGRKVVLIDREDDRKYNLTIIKLLRGIRQYIEEGNDHYGVFSSKGLDAGNFDSLAGDIVFQLALFNDVIYG